jgi:tRNA 2-thiouridine synthesizing protein A
MIKIDVRGFGCPIPVVKAKKAMDEHPGQPITVLVETAVSKENLTRLAESRKYDMAVEETGENEYRIVLTPPRR